MANGSKIIAGLRDAVAHARGDASAARVSTVNVPNEVDVRQIRHRLTMTQREFALRFGFSLCTIRNWEQGRRYPSGSDRVFLTLIERAPDTVQEILAQAA
jgi:putative transcriptional regulator